MANLLANTTIPHLTITTGHGNELRRRIEARAIRILEQQSAEHIGHMRALLEG